MRAPLMNVKMQEAATEAPPPPTPLEIMKGMPGISGPLGFFDPLGYCEGEGVTEGKIRFYREAEIKHGRVAMLAALGFLVGEQFHPLFGGDIDVPSYIAFQETPLQASFFPVVASLAIFEVFSVFSFENPKDGMWSIKADHVPGDFGFDPLGLKPTDPAELAEMQTKELNNGREFRTYRTVLLPGVASRCTHPCPSPAAITGLAMIAIAGMVGQELANGGKLF